MTKYQTSSYLYRLQRLLESQQWQVLPVCASDAPVDMIALRDGVARAYRCKFHGNVYEAEMRKLRDFAERTGTKVYIAKENGEHAIRLREVQ